jgi:hypothetical protein
MDEQMLMKHYGESTQCLKAIKTGEWIGARLNRLTGLLRYTKTLLVARGEFIHANPRDPIYHGRGKVTVYKDVVTLGEDFVVGPGRGFHVYLVPEKNVTTSTKVDESMYVDLGACVPSRVARRMVCRPVWTSRTTAASSSGARSSPCSSAPQG